MADITKLNYDELTSIMILLRGEEQDINLLRLQTQRKVFEMRGNGAMESMWTGQAADRFFNEMESVVLPKTLKLFIALNEACTVLNNIMNIIKQADEETKGFFADLG